MVEVMKIMATSFKTPCAHTAALCAPNPAAGHCQPTPLPETPGHSQASLGQSPVGSLLLPPGSWYAPGFVCALQESVPPVLCEFCNELHPEPLPLQQATADKDLCRRHSDPGPAQPLWGLWVLVHKALFEPSKCLWQVWGLTLNVTSRPLPSCWGFSFALRRAVSFFGGIQPSPADGCSAVSCNFGVLTGEDRCTSFYSPIFNL